VGLADGDRAGPVAVGVRPEHVRVEPNDADGPWTATVPLVQFEGADAFVHLDSDGLGEVVARMRADRAPAEGVRVRVGFDTAAIHVFDARTGRRIPTTGDGVESSRPPQSEGRE
jgi:ABC-type sugar transport system ATPase subunit